MLAIRYCNNMLRQRSHQKFNVTYCNKTSGVVIKCFQFLLINLLRVVGLQVIIASSFFLLGNRSKFIKNCKDLHQKDELYDH